MADSYDEYWIRKVQQLWQAHEQLRRKVELLESRTVARVERREEKVERVEPALSERELTACMALKELGDFSTVEEINRYLRETRNIDEPLRETLLLRLRGAVEKGYVKYDSKSKKFKTVKETFLVR